MLAFITETETVWERLEKTTKPLVLYGMGNGADKILDWCEEHGVRVAAIFASDEFVRGQSFRGFTVVKYADVVAKYPDFLLVIAFASESQVVLRHFHLLAQQHETVAPHLPLFAGDPSVSWQWLAEHEQDLQEVYEHLADAQSQRVFAALLNYKLSGKITYLEACETQRLADCQELYTFDEEETYLDLGAYDGDTLEEFLGFVQGRYRQIVAVEPDGKNFKKLIRFVEEAGLPAVELVPQGIWQQAGYLQFNNTGGRQAALGVEGKTSIAVTSVDELLGTRRASYIKMDVEGAEYQALCGGADQLRSAGPKLFVAAYHRDDDLWRLPQLIWQLRPDYQIYLRKHPYIPAWEINLLCVCPSSK